MRAKILLIAAAAVAFSLAGTASVQAQSPWRTERPYRGLFGSGFGETSQQLTASARVGAGIDNNVLLSTGLVDITNADPRFTRSGSYGVGSVGLSYTLQRGAFSFGASVAGATRYYGNIGNTSFVNSTSAGVNASYRLRTNTQLTAGTSLSFQPYNLSLLSPTPAVSDLPGQSSRLLDDHFPISPVRYRHYSTNAGVAQGFQLGRRSSLDFAYNYRRADTSGLSRTYWGHGATGRYTYEIARGIGVYGGYRYDEYWYPGPDGESRRTPLRSADFGIDLDRALSRTLSRRFGLTLSAGTSAIAQAGIGEGTTRTQRYFFTGSAVLNREFFRTWNWSLSYNRGVAFIETFNEPFFSDGVSASIGGLFNQRLRFVAGASTSLGQVGTSGRRPYDAYTASTSLTLAVHRLVAAGVSYGYARYSFSGTTELPPGSLPHAERHGAQVYLTTVVPLYSRARRPDATR